MFFKVCLYLLLKYTTAETAKPIVYLQPFLGKQREQEEYRDTFVTLIHIVKTLSDCLLGDTADLITQDLTAIHEYASTWYWLLERLNNLRLVSATHIFRLLERKSIEQISATALSQLAPFLYRSYNILKKLNIDHVFSDS